MATMTIACVGIQFDSKKESVEHSINLPPCTKILSVHAKNNEPILWTTYMYPSESSIHDAWQMFHFVISKANYTRVHLDKHQYIGTINIDDDILAVFYKEIAIKPYNYPPV